MTFGTLLRRWRTARRLSQLALAVDAGISTRHLSFLETGRAQPSREMVHLLAGMLAPTAADRNALLIAAGYAPVHDEVHAAPFDRVPRALAAACAVEQAEDAAGAVVAHDDVRVAVHDERRIRLLLAKNRVDVLRQIRIKSFFPADDATERFAREAAACERVA